MDLGLDELHDKMFLGDQEDFVLQRKGNIIIIIICSSRTL